MTSYTLTQYLFALFGPVGLAATVWFGGRALRNLLDRVKR